MSRSIVASALLCSFLLACSTANETPPRRDLKRPPDWGQLDQQPDSPAPDFALPPDYMPKPDSKPAADKPPKGEPNPCGNKLLDPGEQCDKGIPAGQLGACPQSAADCDDQNKCTTDTFSGSPADCTALCEHQPLANCCGNGKIEATEECDDGNVVDNDGCSNNCKLPGGHLLITELAVSPGEAEFVEIYNPTTQPIPLDNVYLTDRVDYFQITKGGLSSVSTDFIARFPPGSSIAPGAHVTVAVKSLNFKIAYGKAPDYELVNTEAAVPDMAPAFSGSIGAQTGLTDTGEILILFTWDGASDLVQDLDYVAWKGSSGTAVFKNASICIDGPDPDTTPTCYKDDTPVTVQLYLQPPQQGGSLHRCNYLEGAEKKTGGNGAGGHDETSEPFDGLGATWKRNPNTLKLRTPGAPAAPGFCPIS